MDMIKKEVHSLELPSFIESLNTEMKRRKLISSKHQIKESLKSYISSWIAPATWLELFMNTRKYDL